MGGRSGSLSIFYASLLFVWKDDAILWMLFCKLRSLLVGDSDARLID